MKTAATAVIFLCLGFIIGWTGNRWTRNLRPSLDQDIAQATTPQTKHGSTGWLIEQFQKDISEGFEKRSQEVHGEIIAVRYATPTNPPTVKINGKTFVNVGPEAKDKGCIAYKEVETKLSDEKYGEMISDCNNGEGWYVTLTPDVMDK